MEDAAWEFYKNRSEKGTNGCTDNNNEGRDDATVSRYNIYIYKIEEAASASEGDP